MDVRHVEDRQLALHHTGPITWCLGDPGGMRPPGSPDPGPAGLTPVGSA
jgi:hypothetical protein